MIDTTEFDISSAAETKLRNILTASSTAPASGAANFRQWFLQQFMQRENDCSLEKFALYFLDELRQRTYVHLRTTKAIKSSCLNDVNVDEVQLQRPTVQGENPASFDDYNKGNSKSLELQSFPLLATPCSKNLTQVSPQNASTPARKNLKKTSQQQQPKNIQTHHQRRSVDSATKSCATTTTTTSNNSSFNKSRNSTGDGSTGSKSFCLGDFLTSPTTISNRHSSAQKKKPQPSTTSTPNSNSKPKKRVVPISVSRASATTIQPFGSPFGLNSSFSQENNILILSQTSQTEIKDFNKCAIAEARKALQNDLSEASFVLKASTPTKKCASMKDAAKQSMQNIDIACTPIAPPIANMEEEYHSSESLPISLNKIPSKITAQLKIIASIYGILLDMNLTSNILREISFILNLLNANVPKKELQKPENENGNGNGNDPELCAIENASTSLESGNVFELLKKVINSIFFAKCVLEEQQHTLALIDSKSLGVVLQSERLACLSTNLMAFLTSVYTQKQACSVVASHDISTFDGLKNVCFQEDSNSRKFFQNESEFAAFRRQRDLFYSALKSWEKYHLDPSWKFRGEIARKIPEILRKSENPINMTHFAKLFVAQLLISATEQTSPEEVGIGMEDVDLEKFNKLSQRLVAPSDFSVDYQFPREQAFFRDFIIESRSIPFMEHLKMVLSCELVTLNDSTFEQHNLHAEDGYCEGNNENEFIVRPQVLGSMLILAKFLGFVTALPFQGSSTNDDSTPTHSTIIESYQLRLRKRFQTPINITDLLETAISNNRHLITLPWIVQYLAMLDDVTLQLDSLLEITKNLYTLYTELGNGELRITATSAFIVRCCLGWLFEQKPIIGAGYINYRITQDKLMNMERLGKTTLDIAKIPAAATTDIQIKSMLDSILHVACPFLAEFRVSIMPAKHAVTKYVSRTGRFRHITPCIADSNAPRAGEQIAVQPTVQSTLTSIDNGNDLKSLHTVESNLKKRQNILMESFLHAQNNSMRNLIVFLTERVYKCVVKDAQYKILLPSKSAADSQVNQISSLNKNDVLEQVKAIYKKARYEAYKQWDIQVPEMLVQRTDQSLEALLPIETTAIIKKAYAWRIRTVAKTKIDQWRYMNLSKNDFYCCDDINELTAKICKVNAANSDAKSSGNHTTELKLVKSQPSISDLIEEMQHWLYTTGFETNFQHEAYVPDRDISKNKEIYACNKRDIALIDFLERLKASFENTLPTIYYRLIASGLVQILQHLISKSPIQMTDALIQAACQFFSNDKICVADVVSTPNNNDNNKATICVEDPDNNEVNVSVSTTTTTTTPASTTTIYHALITAPFIQSLGSNHICYEKLKQLLCALIQSDVISMDFVNQLFLSVFKEDLNVGVFDSISKMLYEIAQKSNTSPTKRNKTVDYDDSDSDNELKSQLLMEVLADLSRDLDNL